MKMSNENLKLWDSVKETDEKFTKKVNQRGGYTAITPQYQMQEATKTFGAYGLGWGFESIEMDYSAIESLGLVIVKAVFFYYLDGKRGSFPINNTWPVKQGSRVDSDFAKKAETNTMGKALSKLGFNADVFMGQFDDPDYVEGVTNKKNLEKAEDKIAEQAKQDQEWSEWKQKELKAYEKIPNLEALKVVFTGHIKKIKLRGDDAAIRMFTKFKDDRKAELEKNETL